MTIYKLDKIKKATLKIEEISPNSIALINDGGVEFDVEHEVLWFLKDEQQVSINGVSKSKNKITVDFSSNYFTVGDIIYTIKKRLQGKYTVLVPLKYAAKIFVKEHSRQISLWFFAYSLFTVLYSAASLLNVIINGDSLPFIGPIGLSTVITAYLTTKLD